MTKFAKGVLTIGFIACLGVGGKYGYEYLKSNGYLDPTDKTNITAEEVEKIDTFLNDEVNIGFLQANYDSIDLNNVDINTIAYLINNYYEVGEDGKVFLVDFEDSKVYSKFITSYDPNLVNITYCYDAVKLNEYLYSITNMNMVALQNVIDDKICTAKLSNYIYLIDANINYVYKKNDEYNVEYTIKSIDSITYNQKYGYDNLDVKYYTGKLKLEQTDDGRYIFISNELPGAKNLYSF